MARAPPCLLLAKGPQWPQPLPLTGGMEKVVCYTAPPLTTDWLTGLSVMQPHPWSLIGRVQQGCKPGSPLSPSVTRSGGSPCSGLHVWEDFWLLLVDPIFLVCFFFLPWILQ